MSHRGGRGGGGARGGGLKGATWEHDPELRVETRPIGDFPQHPHIKKPQPFSAKERRQMKAHKKLAQDFHRGPLFTQPTKRDTETPTKIFSEADSNGIYTLPGKADIDPFEKGVPTYSQKYFPPTRTIPQLSERYPFNKELFPEELWSILGDGGGEKLRKDVNRIALNKASLMSSTPQEMAVRDRIIDERIKAATGGKDDEAEVEEDDDPEAELEDYDFEDDEDDMGGDYNGERYFDNGEGVDSDENDGGYGDDN